MATAARKMVVDNRKSQKSDHPSNVRIVKIIMVGNSNVGKTSIVERFSSDSFADHYIPTIGIDFVVQELVLEDALVVKLHVWDTAGSEKFEAITKNYFHVANGAIIVFDTTDRKSFNAVPKWIKKLNDNCPLGTPVLLLGNKADEQDRVISEMEGAALGQKWNLPFLLCSAKSNYNIYKAFFRMTKIVLSSTPPEQLMPGFKIKQEEDKEQESKCRC